MRTQNRQGFSLVELIFAIAVFAVLVAGVTFLAVGTYYSYGGTGDKREQERLAREAVEALQAIKERDWNLIATFDDGSTVKVTKNAATHGPFPQVPKREVHSRGRSRFPKCSGTVPAISLPAAGATTPAPRR